MITRRCENCGKDFKTYPSNVKRGSGRFCSRHCSGIILGIERRIDVSKRFWQKVTERDSEQCWTWNASTNADGYGTILVNGRCQHAHRVSYQLTYGSIPKGLSVLHHCDNPTCVNPKHLFLGTQHDNIIDCKTKHRNRNGHMKGETNPMVRLTEQKVREIRSIFSDSPKDFRRNQYTKGKRLTIYQSLAKRFNVHPSTICQIVLGNRWKHIK